MDLRKSTQKKISCKNLTAVSAVSRLSAACSAVGCAACGGTDYSGVGYQPTERKHTDILFVIPNIPHFVRFSFRLSSKSARSSSDSRLRQFLVSVTCLSSNNLCRFALRVVVTQHLVSSGM